MTGGVSRDLLPGIFRGINGSDEARIADADSLRSNAYGRAIFAVPFDICSVNISRSRGDGTPYVREPGRKWSWESA